MNQRKFSRIAYRLFMAKARFAKFELNYNNVKKDDRGIYVPIDGHLDFSSINETFSAEQNNLNKLADDFSKAIIENKSKISILSDIDVDTIDSNQYKIIHNEHTNEMYLFLPVYAYKSSAKTKKDHATETEKSSRTPADLDAIINGLQHLLDTYKYLMHEDPTVGKITLKHVEHEENVTNGKYDFTMKVERAIGRKNDKVESRLYLTLKYDGEEIYDKGYQNTYKYKDYNLVSRSMSTDGSEFLKADNDNDYGKMKHNIESIIDKCTNTGDKDLIETFKKDLENIS